MQYFVSVNRHGLPGKQSICKHLICVYIHIFFCKIKKLVFIVHDALLFLAFSTCIAFIRTVIHQGMFICPHCLTKTGQ